MKQTPKAFTAADFRKELADVLPGYKWTVSRSSPTASPLYLTAQGIQSSGFNRTSTLKVIRKESQGGLWYEVDGYGYGTRDNRLGGGCGLSLKKAVRCLQDYYEYQRQTYTTAHRGLEAARIKPSSPDSAAGSATAEAPAGK